MEFFPIILLFLYFVPSYIALYRHHHKRKAIIWLNLIVGWTIIGWVGLNFYAALTKVEMTDSSQIDKKD